MNRRELARDYFKRCNIIYDDITMNDLYKLIQILNKKITETGSCMIMINEPKLRGRNRNIIFKNEKLKFAEIRVKGSYFDDREAINNDDTNFISYEIWNTSEVIGNIYDEVEND